MSKDSKLWDASSHEEGFAAHARTHQHVSAILRLLTRNEDNSDVKYPNFAMTDANANATVEEWETQLGTVVCTNPLLGAIWLIQRKGASLPIGYSSNLTDQHPEWGPHNNHWCMKERWPSGVIDNGHSGWNC